MSIFYVNAPSFAVAIERLREPSLRRHPVAVAAHMSPQAALIAVSSEARALGVYPGQKASEALRWERRLRIVPADPALYRKAQEKMLGVVERFTPLYEAERPGSYYLDMAGTERLFGKALDAASKIQAEIARSLHLDLTLGVAENKLVSQVAAQVARPAGLCDIFPGAEADFLAPLDLDYLPAFQTFQDAADRALFRELALARIGDLARVPGGVLTHILGRKAERLKEQALGIDARPVLPPRRGKTVEETVSLAAETNDDDALLASLWAAVQIAARRLRDLGAVAAEARMEGIQIDAKPLIERIGLTPPTHGDFTLFAALRKIWPRFLKRRVALKSLRLILAGLRPAFRQLDFENADREPSLIAVLDRVRDRYGRDAVKILRGS